MKNEKSASEKIRNPVKTDLHKVIRENYQQVFFEKEIFGTTLPFHLKREFDKYLKCGILSYGFARFHCGHCQNDKLVAFSCKGRTICPSCNGRRMAETAKHLVENVIPAVPVRQWVLSMPYAHRFLLSSDSELLSSTLAIFHRLIGSFYKKRAKKLRLKNPKVGAMSVVQRFGGALNLNIHFHTLFMDGVYFENRFGEKVFKEIIPTDYEIIALALKAKIRINRAFMKRGLLTTEDDHCLGENYDSSSNEQLDLLRSQSVQNRVDGGQRPEAIGKWLYPSFVEFSGKKCAYNEGFSLHAGVKILKHQRSSLERLCRYIARGAVPLERLSLTETGSVRLKLKTPYSDGTTHLEFTPDQFIKRIISLIPPPRQNFIRYYGVFGARHKNRAEITSKVPGKKKEKTKKKIYRTPWADLLRRVFKYEVDYCDRCGTKLQLIATITSPLTCKRILDHLKIHSHQFEVARPRGPPDNFNFCEDSTQYFDQAQSW